jgi:hypothetical protein
MKNARIVGTAECSATSLFSLFGGMMSIVISKIELTRPPERQRKKKNVQFIFLEYALYV